MHIISYNTLANSFAEPESYWDRYPQIKDRKIISWDYRLPIILKSIITENADVILLQEIELASFENDFSSLFDTYSFWRHEISKKRTNHIGNVILWRNNLIPEKKTATSCSLIIEFNDFWAINVHLKAGLTSGEKDRVCQVKSLLKNVNWQKPGFISGDFNDVLNSPCQYNVATQGLVAKELSKFQIHSNLNSCYVYNKEHNSNNYWTFDHVISHKLQVAIKNRTSDIPFPNETEPSDHLMMVFEISADK